MDTIRFQKLDGHAVEISKDDIKQRLSGKLLMQNTQEYNEARCLWNGMIDKVPSLIIQVMNDQDVVNAVDFARHNSILLAIKSGGHNIAGKALVDGGLVIDFSQLSSVTVDEKQQTAKVRPGATLADVDKATQKHGLLVPTGINSTTGIAGLTLGGGFGWTTRKFGLTIDNLRSAKIVTASGELLEVNASLHQDLFWGIRGGGSNFGVITEFEFDLHKAGPEVLAGMIIYPYSEIDTVMKEYQKALGDTPNELTCWSVIRKAPPLPFLPEQWHGQKVLILAMCYCDDIAEGEISTKAIRAIGKPIVEAIGPMPFVDWQAAFDPLLTEGARNYWKSLDMAEISANTLIEIKNAVHSIPSDECEIFIAHVAGAMTNIAEQDTPWQNRKAHFTINVHTRWQDPKDDDRCKQWARTLHGELAEHSMGSVYVNFIPEDDNDSVGDAYGVNYDRLKSIKRKFDPVNLFRVNQNIAP